MAETARAGNMKKLLRDPVLRVLGDHMDPADLRSAVVAAGPRPPEARQQLTERLLREGSFVRDPRLRDAVRGLSASPPSSRESEKTEVAGLVMDVLSREDRYLRSRARRFQEHNRDLRSSRWWRLKGGLEAVLRPPGSRVW